MSQFSVPEVKIDPTRFNITSTPAFQQTLTNMRESAAIVHQNVEKGKKIHESLTKALENPPKFELNPEVKASMQAATAACATAFNAVQEGQRILDEMNSRQAAQYTPSPAAQAAMGRIEAGFDRIERISNATRLPALKTADT